LCKARWREPGFPSPGRHDFHFSVSWKLVLTRFEQWLGPGACHALFQLLDRLEQLVFIVPHISTVQTARDSRGSRGRRVIECGQPNDAVADECQFHALMRVDPFEESLESCKALLVVRQIGKQSL